ncbi:single-stranded DNA-binding protein [Paraburkholderia sp. EG286B]|uniref:single-stranded DNA-binding protein n=1 Tax=Paraburkholderia sp. EG286B TaxID=3237011 RepID=UPI0034D36A04
MIDGLIAGQLVGEPQHRRSGNGNPYLLVRLRVPQGDAPALFAAVFVFDAEAREQLMACGPGDSVCVAGSIKVDIWKPDDGEPRVNLTVTANALVTPYHVRRRRAAMHTSTGGRREPVLQDDTLDF